MGELTPEEDKSDATKGGDVGEGLTAGPPSTAADHEVEACHCKLRCCARGGNFRHRRNICSKSLDRKNRKSESLELVFLAVENNAAADTRLPSPEQSALEVPGCNNVLQPPGNKSMLSLSC